MPPKAFGRSPPPPKRTSTQTATPDTSERRLSHSGTATPDTSERRLSHSGTIVFIVLLVARQLSLYNFEVPYTTADAATPLESAADDPELAKRIRHARLVSGLIDRKVTDHATRLGEHLVVTICIWYQVCGHPPNLLLSRGMS